MKIPAGWSTRAAGGYSSFSRLVHERCGYESRAIDLVLDERSARLVVLEHECEDVREAREQDEELRDRVARLERQVAALTVQLAERG